MVCYPNLVFPNCMHDTTQATPIFHNNSYCIIFLDSPLKNIHFRKTVWFVVLLFLPLPEQSVSQNGTTAILMHI